MRGAMELPMNEGGELTQALKHSLKNRANYRRVCLILREVPV